MRAERDEGSGTCFAIFLPALVMGNFMVLNLFLALLLNSFNSEELKQKKEEVGEESKLTRSFDRIRSILRKTNKAVDRDNERNIKLDQIVREVMDKSDNRKYAVKETVLSQSEEEKLEVEEKRPWHALVSYVDELTIGVGKGGKDGQNFPGFGRRREKKVPQDCFPQECYKR